MNRIPFFLVCLAALGALIISARAQSAPTAPFASFDHKESPWLTTAAVGLSLARGNTDNLLTTGNLLTSKKWEHNEADFGADGSYGETAGVQSAGNIHGFGQYNRLFTEHFYGLLHVDALNDAMADLEYRVTISPGLGYYFIKSTNTFLRAETGPGFVFERQAGVDHQYVTLRLAERFEHTLNSHVKTWQSLEWLPAVHNFADYVLNAEIGLDTSLTKQLSMRTFVKDTFDSTPAPGLKDNDVKLVVGIAYKL
jgi:putative salt-induced outer membrane protein YdiY